MQKNNRRSFDSLRYAPVAQDDSYLVMQLFGAGSINIAFVLPHPSHKNLRRGEDGAPEHC